MPLPGFRAREAYQQPAGLGPERSLSPRGVPLPSPCEQRRQRQDQEQGLQTWQEGERRQRRQGRNQRGRGQPRENLTGHCKEAGTGQPVCTVSIPGVI